MAMELYFVDMVHQILKYVTKHIEVFTPNIKNLFIRYWSLFFYIEICLHLIEIWSADIEVYLPDSEDCSSDIEWYNGALIKHGTYEYIVYKSKTYEKHR